VKKRRRQNTRAKFVSSIALRKIVDRYIID
ncbi:unnamed protein product, partial [marine sediment metagenome]